LDPLLLLPAILPPLSQLLMDPILTSSPCLPLLDVHKVPGRVLGVLRPFGGGSSDQLRERARRRRSRPTDAPHSLAGGKEFMGTVAVLGPLAFISCGRRYPGHGGCFPLLPGLVSPASGVARHSRAGRGCRGRTASTCPVRGPPSPVATGRHDCRQVRR